MDINLPGRMEIVVAPSKLVVEGRAIFHSYGALMAFIVRLKLAAGDAFADQLIDPNALVTASEAKYATPALEC